MLVGYKTYIISACLIIYAITGWVTGQLEPMDAFRIVLEGGVFAALRNAIPWR